MTDEKPTDEELDAIYGAVILAPGAGDEAHFPGLRAVLEAGIAWERARREKRRGERPSHFQLVQQVTERSARQHELDATSDVAHGFDLGVAWADSGESDELAELRERLESADEERDEFFDECAGARGTLLRALLADDDRPLSELAGAAETELSLLRQEREQQDGELIRVRSQVEALNAEVRRLAIRHGRDRLRTAIRNLAARLDRDGGQRQEGETIEETAARLDAGIVRLRANSYAALEVEALTVLLKHETVLTEADLARYGEHRTDPNTGTAARLSDALGRLSQQSAPQAAQGGDNEERALVDCLDARAFHESIATDLEDYARIVETDRLEGADLVEGLREQARQLRKCDRLSRAHAQLATVTRERDEQARGVDHQERLANMFERERDDAMDKVASQAARIAELDGELATTTTVLGEAYAANEALKSERDTLTRELTEAKAYGEERNNECNRLQRYLNLAAEERDSARSALSEAREELRLLGAIEKRVRGVWAPDHALLIALDAHRAKASAKKGPGDANS